MLRRKSLPNRFGSVVAQPSRIWMGRSLVRVQVIPTTLNMVLTAPQPLQETFVNIFVFTYLGSLKEKSHVYGTYLELKIMISFIQLKKH